MALDTLTGRQCDHLAVIQQGVQADQDAGVGNAGRLLQLAHISVANRLHERGIHIADALAWRLFLLHQVPNSDLNQLLQHIVFRLLLVIHASQHLIDTGRMHDDIGDLGKLAFILLLTLETACIRNKLADEVCDLRIGTAGHERIGQIQARCDRLCSHRLSGTGVAAKQEIAHGLAGSRGDLGVFADADDLFRDDVPIRQGRHHRLFPVCEDTRGESVLPHKIFPLERSRSRCRSPTHLHDGEFTVGGASRSIVATIHRHLRNG